MYKDLDSGEAIRDVLFGFETLDDKPTIKDSTKWKDLVNAALAVRLFCELCDDNELEKTLDLTKESAFSNMG